MCDVLRAGIIGGAVAWSNGWSRSEDSVMRQTDVGAAPFIRLSSHQ